MFGELDEEMLLTMLRRWDDDVVAAVTEAADRADATVG